MTNFNIKTICKVSRNFEGLTENTLFIAFNALISLFCFLFLSVVVVFFLFLALHTIFHLLLFALA